MNRFEMRITQTLNNLVEDFDEKSKFEQGLKVGEKSIICGFPLLNPGMFPHEFQNRWTKEAGMKPATLTLYSASSGVLTGIVKNAAGIGSISFESIFNVEMPDIIKIPSYLMAGIFAFSFMDAGIRLTYSSITKKACGTLLAEAGYSLWKRYLRKSDNNGNVYINF